MFSKWSQSICLTPANTVRLQKTNYAAAEEKEKNDHLITLQDVLWFYGCFVSMSIIKKFEDNVGIELWIRYFICTRLYFMFCVAFFVITYFFASSIRIHEQRGLCCWDFFCIFVVIVAAVTILRFILSCTIKVVVLKKEEKKISQTWASIRAKSIETEEVLHFHVFFFLFFIFMFLFLNVLNMMLDIESSLLVPFNINIWIWINGKQIPELLVFTDFIHCIH